MSGCVIRRDGADHEMLVNLLSPRQRATHVGWVQKLYSRAIHVYGDWR